MTRFTPLPQSICLVPCYKAFQATITHRPVNTAGPAWATWPVPRQGNGAVTLESAMAVWPPGRSPRLSACTLGDGHCPVTQQHQARDGVLSGSDLQRLQQHVPGPLPRDGGGHDDATSGYSEQQWNAGVAAVVCQAYQRLQQERHASVSTLVRWLHARQCRSYIWFDMHVNMRRQARTSSNRKWQSSNGDRADTVYRGLTSIDAAICKLEAATACAGHLLSNALK
jgi:hypothetical protein